MFLCMSAVRAINVLGQPAVMIVGANARVCLHDTFAGDCQLPQKPQFRIAVDALALRHIYAIK
jgi:hypothetical protein